MGGWVGGWVGGVQPSSSLHLASFGFWCGPSLLLSYLPSKVAAPAPNSTTLGSTPCPSLHSFTNVYTVFLRSSILLGGSVSGG